MKRELIVKTAKWAGSVSMLLTAVLCVHIYLVTRPKAPDATTVIMARIDLKQDINQDEASKISAWLYQQKGIDHVLCNPATDILVFTFFPVKTNANSILTALRSQLNYGNATRYMPSEAELKGGCPVATTSVTYKAYNFIRHIL